MSLPVETDYRRWGEPRRFSVADFLALDRLEDGLILVEEGGLELPMLVANRGAAATFIGFHAAMNPGVRRPLPFLQGRGIAPKSLNTILLGDPSLGLHEDVKVGWFLGSRRFDVPAVLPRLLDHADRLMGASRRLLWGVSAGGTAALLYARGEDTVVAVNPQTNVARFTWGRTRPWIEHGWGETGRAAKALAAEMGDLTRRPPAAGRIVYVQNARDDHLADHMAPFLAMLGVPATAGRHGRVTVVLDDWGEGHVPPPPRRQAAILAEEAARLLGRRPGWWARLWVKLGAVSG